VNLIPLFPLDKLEFCAQSHFVSRQLHCVHTIGAAGVPGYLRDSANLADSFSLTFLTDLSTPGNPFFIDLRVDSNTENDFINFVKAAIAAQCLQPGDFFIVDNASIHFAANSHISETKWKTHGNLIHARKMQVSLQSQYHLY